MAGNFLNFHTVNCVQDIYTVRSQSSKTRKSKLYSVKYCEEEKKGIYYQNADPLPVRLNFAINFLGEFGDLPGSQCTVCNCKEKKLHTV